MWINDLVPKTPPNALPHFYQTNEFWWVVCILGFSVFSTDINNVWVVRPEGGIARFLKILFSAVSAPWGCTEENFLFLKAGLFCEVWLWVNGSSNHETSIMILSGSCKRRMETRRKCIPEKDEEKQGPDVMSIFRLKTRSQFAKQTYSITRSKTLFFDHSRNVE